MVSKKTAILASRFCDPGQGPRLGAPGAICIKIGSKWTTGRKMIKDRRCVHEGKHWTREARLLLVGSHKQIVT